MEIDTTEIIRITNDLNDYCAYFDKFDDSNTTIKISNKTIKVFRELVMKHSDFFKEGMSYFSTRDNIYELDILKNENFNQIRDIISFTYGCDLEFNIKFFSNYYFIANYLLIDTLSTKLVNNLIDGFLEGRYQLYHAVNIIQKIFYNENKDLNTLLKLIIANNFNLLKDYLYSVDVNILSEIIVGNNLNIDSENDLIYFLDEYYLRNKNNILLTDMNSKLISKIRMLTLSVSEILNVRNLSLNIFLNYNDLITKSYLVKQDNCLRINKCPDNNSLYSKANLMINYKDIYIPRFSVVDHELYKFDEIKDFFPEIFKSNKYNVKLPIFTAIVIDTNPLILKILDDTIEFLVGSILVRDSGNFKSIATKEIEVNNFDLTDDEINNTSYFYRYNEYDDEKSDDGEYFVKKINTPLIGTMILVTNSYLSTPLDQNRYMYFIYDYSYIFEYLPAI